MNKTKQLIAISLVASLATLAFAAPQAEKPPVQIVTPIVEPSQTGSALERSLVAHEIERREGTKVSLSDVQVTQPGVARVTLPRGTATLQFGYRDPMQDCPVNATHAQYEKCVEATQANPLGFTVQSYAVQSAH